MSFIAGYIAGLEEAKPKIYNQPTITKNGVYPVPAEYDGFGDITVDVPGGFDLFNVILQFETFTTCTINNRYSLEIKIGDLSNYGKSQYGYVLTYDGSKYKILRMYIYKTIFVVVYDGVKPAAIIEGGKGIAVYSKNYDTGLVYDIYEITSLSLNSVTVSGTNLTLKLNIAYKETDTDGSQYPKTGNTVKEYTVNLNNCFTDSNDRNNCYTNLTLEEMSEFYLAFFNTLLTTN